MSRVLAITAALIVAGCALDWSYPEGTASGAGLGGAGGASASASGTATGSAGSATGTSSGSTEPECGNGIIEPPEECDPIGDSVNEFCTDCLVTCSGANRVKRPGTNHCYVRLEGHASWNAWDADCALTGGYLATLVNLEEHSFVLSENLITSETWIGGKHTGDMSWTWEPTGEPFTYAPWDGDVPTSGCLVALTNDHWVGDACTSQRPALCEYPPRGD